MIFSHGSEERSWRVWPVLFGSAAPPPPPPPPPHTHQSERDGPSRCSLPFFCRMASHMSVKDLFSARQKDWLLFIHHQVAHSLSPQSSQGFIPDSSSSSPALFRKNFNRRHSHGDTKLWRGLQDLYRAYVVIFVRACVHTGVGHTPTASQHIIFHNNKNSHFSCAPDGNWTFVLWIRVQCSVNWATLSPLITRIYSRLHVIITCLLLSRH